MIKKYVKNLKPIALVISSYQPNKMASDMLRMAIKSIQTFNHKDACIWVIDVDSPIHDDFVHPEEFPEVNFVITDKPPLDYSDFPLWKRLLGKRPERKGSYANGATLELAPKVFKKLKYEPKYFMTLQMDVIASHPDWLQNLLDLFEEGVIASGVREQENYGHTQNIIHSLGCIWDYAKMCELGLSLMPSFPGYDVAEKAQWIAQAKGYKIASLPNSHITPELVDKIPEPFRGIHADRTLNKNNEVIFLHLGRGIVKSVNGTPPGKTSSEEWFTFGEKFLADQKNS